MRKPFEAWCSIATKVTTTKDAIILGGYFNTVKKRLLRTNITSYDLNDLFGRVTIRTNDSKEYMLQFYSKDSYTKFLKEI